MFINIESYTEQLNSGENLADIANSSSHVQRQ